MISPIWPCGASCGERRRRRRSANKSRTSRARTSRPGADAVPPNPPRARSGARSPGFPGRSWLRARCVRCCQSSSSLRQLAGWRGRLPNRRKSRRPCLPRGATCGGPSPITQRSASTRLDLPQPFGPDHGAGQAGLIMKSVGSTNDLNPCRRRRVSFIAAASSRPLGRANLLTRQYRAIGNAVLREFTPARPSGWMSTCRPAPEGNRGCGLFQRLFRVSGDGGSEKDEIRQAARLSPLSPRSLTGRSEATRGCNTFSNSASKRKGPHPKLLRASFARLCPRKRRWAASDVRDDVNLDAVGILLLDVTTCHGGGASFSACGRAVPEKIAMQSLLPRLALYEVRNDGGEVVRKAALSSSAAGDALGKLLERGLALEHLAIDEEGRRRIHL